VDHELAPAVELQDNEFQETPDFIEAKPELSCRIVIVEVCDIRRLGRRSERSAHRSRAGGQTRELPLRRAEPRAYGGADGFGASDVLGLSSSTQRLEEVRVKAHRHNRARTIAEGLPTSFAEQLNGVAGFGLVGPHLDLLVADRLAFDHP
jgi:hypothetical protein